MSSSATIALPDFRTAFEAAAGRMAASREELCTLDAVAGDGDLGSTLALGFEAARASGLSEHADIGSLLSSIGRTFAVKAPSTMGTLLGAAFMRSGKALTGKATLDAADIATMLEEMAASVAERGRAELGERTVLDSMTAAARAARTAAATGATPAETLAVAAAAASKAAAETAAMAPRHGRAGWIGERARGRPDAGAAAWAIYVTALSEATRITDEHPTARRGLSA